jgi:hypothetical protein
MIFVWRALTKQLLHRTLPPLFRIMERLSLDQPRAFFRRASTYQKVPYNLDENEHPLPTIRRIPSMVKRIARAGRTRSVSIGPQSVGDVYEMIDYQHELRKRERSNSRSRGDNNNPDFLSVNDMSDKQGLALNADGQHDNSNNDDEDDDGVDEAELWKNIPPVRVRYDVEVVTRIICYCGIGWISTDLVYYIFNALEL